MLGTFAGKIMKEGKENRKGVVRLLLLLGIVLIGYLCYGVCKCLLLSGYGLVV